MIRLFSVKTRRKLSRYLYQNIVLPIAVCLAWLFILSLAGCTSMPDANDERETTKLVLDITASPKANPDQRGRYSPIMVTVYELKSPALFQEMDFYSLQTNGKDVLGEDLLNKEDFILQPGETLHVRHKTSLGTTAIGIAAGHRNISYAIWKKVYTLAPAPYAPWYRSLIPANRSEQFNYLDTNEVEVLPMHR